MKYLYLFQPDGSPATRVVVTGDEDAMAIVARSRPANHALSEVSHNLASVYFDGELKHLPKQTHPSHQWSYTQKQWIDPRTPEDHLLANRARRTQLLAASDWTQLPDVPTATQAAWAGYRQALRDITNQPDPASIVWPTPPA